MSEELKRGIPKAIVIGHVEFTKEEKIQHDKDFTKILREYGVIKDNESVKNGKVIKDN